MTDTLLTTPSVLGAGARIGALRRGARESQRDFTTLLDVLARPGKIGRLDVPDAVPAAAAAACGLIDVEVTLHVLTAEGEDARGWGDAVHAATSAPRAELDAARTVVALRPLSGAEIAVLHRGDALNPEQGARLFAAVDTLTDGGSAGGVLADGETVLLLSGPGVPGERRFGVRGLPMAVIEALTAVNSGFPLGVDTFLVAADGAVTGLPRTTRVRVEVAGG
ncbi:phosphonate C-P lyase system protein PhnH [Streptomyces sp. 150FB]|uniref:phosphonate C-P lyase system protein PhnH n=1 Tax=Streptomyces sp. 150FB TaxID=1576605 RepID=UPI0006983DB6|nr:phosphonate C-P lyase system protein PhnH [Streptomyces sp. 150FB]